jgi:hypothetical protein
MKKFTKKIITICFVFNILFFQLYLLNSDDQTKKSPVNLTQEWISQAKQKHINNMHQINKDYFKKASIAFGAMYFLRRIIFKK